MGLKLRTFDLKMNHPFDCDKQYDELQKCLVGMFLFWNEDSGSYLVLPSHDFIVTKRMAEPLTPLPLTWQSKTCIR